VDISEQLWNGELNLIFEESSHENEIILPICVSYKMDSLETVDCDVQVEKSFPTCEHLASMACSQNPSTCQCKSRCGLTLSCCGKACNAPCYECQVKNVLQEDEKTIRTQHRNHPCEKSLHCGHRCQEYCSKDHEHTTSCKKKCRQSCVHTQCHRPCSTPCAPCQEPCTW